MGGGGGIVGAVTGAVTGTVTGGPVGFFTGAAEGYSSGKAQSKANKLQKQQQALQASIIGKQKSEALEARKNQIAQMREQIGTGGYSTRATSEKGIVGSIKQDTLG
jgi:hypothetical protein